jgi:hypothetical protein
VFGDGELVRDSGGDADGDCDGGEVAEEAEEEDEEEEEEESGGAMDERHRANVVDGARRVAEQSALAAQRLAACALFESSDDSSLIVSPQCAAIWKTALSDIELRTTQAMQFKYCTPLARAVRRRERERGRARLGAAYSPHRTDSTWRRFDPPLCARRRRCGAR